MSGVSLSRSYVTRDISTKLTWGDAEEGKEEEEEEEEGEEVKEVKDVM